MNKSIRLERDVETSIGYTNNRCVLAEHDYIGEVVIVAAFENPITCDGQSRTISTHSTSSPSLQHENMKIKTHLEHIVTPHHK